MYIASQKKGESARINDLLKKWSFNENFWYNCVKNNNRAIIPSKMSGKGVFRGKSGRNFSKTKQFWDHRSFFLGTI